MESQSQLIGVLFTFVKLVFETFQKNYFLVFMLPSSLEQDLFYHSSEIKDFSIDIKRNKT